MINYDDVTKENINNHNPNWPKILDQSYGILTIGDSGSGKTSTLINLIKQQWDDDYSTINNIYSYSKDPNEAKYIHLIEKREIWSWEFERAKGFY